MVIVNQATVKAFGFKEPLNEIIGHANGRRYRIIGVVQDFNYESLRASIEPAVFFLTKRGSKCYINLNLNQENISRVKEVWGKFTNEPIEFNFLETNFQEQISVEKENCRMDKPLYNLGSCYFLYWPSGISNLYCGSTLT